MAQCLGPASSDLQLYDGDLTQRDLFHSSHRLFSVPPMGHVVVCWCADCCPEDEGGSLEGEAGLPPQNPTQPCSEPFTPPTCTLTSASPELAALDAPRLPHTAVCMCTCVSRKWVAWMHTVNPRVQHG